MASERIEKLKRRPAAAPAEGVTTAAAVVLPPMEVLDPPEKVKPAKKPKAEKPVIHYQCGHKVGVGQFTKHDCAACRAEKRKANRLAKRAAREARPRPEGCEDRGRLPDGAEFHVAYSAADKCWKGRLLIVDCNGVAKDFTSTHSGVFKLLAALDAQYRAWLVEQGPPVESTP